MNSSNTPLSTQRSLSHKEVIASALSPLLEKTPEEILPMIAEAPENVEGDFSLPCFPFAKTQRKAPNIIAQELSQQITLPSGISNVVPVQGYLNFCVDPVAFTKGLLEDILNKSSSYGHSEVGKGKTVLVDFSSPNMGKELAFHHLRGTMLGNAISHVYNALGYHVKRLNHLGDWGTSYGKLIVMYLKEGLSLKEEDMTSHSIETLNKLYASFSKASEQDPALEEEARKAFQELEQGNAQYHKMWEAFRTVTLKELHRLYDILNVHFDEYNGEAFFVPHTSKLIQELESKNLLQTSEGATIVDLEKHEMPPLLLKKSDGSTLYATRDLCAALYRWDTFSFHKNYYVVDNGQSLHFKQFFKVLELMGHTWTSHCEHIPFGLVLNKTGDGKWEKGKTRTGHSSLLKDVLEKATEKILLIIQNKNPALKNKEEIAQKIAVGALVFNDLKHKRQNNVKFEWDSVLSFEGDTGPYVVNAYVRLASILRKAEWVQGHVSVLQGNSLQEPEAKKLLKELSRLSEKLQQVVQENEPYLLGQYALSLAEKIHSFIHHCRIIGSEQQEERLLLAYCAKIVLGNTLELLGVPTVEEM
jgi:arginyl-tRNA synthetase